MMEQIFLSLGINGVVALTFYIFLKHFFENINAERNYTREVVNNERETNKENINNLCCKIDKLIETIHDEIAFNTQNRVSFKNETDNIKDQYIRTANKVESIRKEISNISERQVRVIEKVESIENIVSNCRNNA